MRSIRVQLVGSMVRVTLVDGDTEVNSWEGRTLTGDRALAPIAKATGTDAHWLRTRIDKGEGTYPLPESEAEAEGETEAPVTVRGINESEGKEYPSIDVALGLADAGLMAAEPLIVWEGVKKLCALDVDFHHVAFDDRPTTVPCISPSPCYAWVTHGRGFRFIYKSQEGYDADELAAVGAARLLQIEPLATVELKSSTRHPASPNADGRLCSGVESRTPTTDCRAISGWYESRGEISEEQRDEWLEEHGYAIGQRYTHDRCPVDSGTTSHGTPVAVYANGIHCFGCAGHGVRRGTRAPGWFPYEVFVGHSVPSAISACVSNLTHWEHAKFVLAAHHGLLEPILRGAYSAMLKQRHGVKDPRLPAVWKAGRDVVRYEGYWGTLEGESFKETRADAILEKLPSCRIVEGMKTKVDGERVARLLQTTDLRNLGYPHLRPVWGLPIYSYHLEPRYPYEIVLCKCVGEKPVYRKPEQRMNEEEAWGRLEVVFPGLNRNVIRLLIAAKGCAEASSTFLPFVFLTGPTGAAKSTSCIIAATICGDRVHSIPSIGDDTRLRAAIFEAKTKSTFAVFNEATKTGRGSKITKAEAMEYILSLTPDSMSHKLWVGPVMLGDLPVCCWSDVAIPQEIRQHGQIGRRVVHVHLDSRMEWHESVRKAGIGKAEWLRADRDLAEASDTILCEVIDRFFSAPATFEEIARSLGFKLLNESEDAKDQQTDLRMLYELVQTLPDRNGWKEIDLTSNSAVSTVWRELADRPDFKSSARCSECDWARLLGLSSPVVFAVNSKGSVLRVKFDGVAEQTVPQMQGAATSP